MTFSFRRVILLGTFLFSTVPLAIVIIPLILEIRTELVSRQSSALPLISEIKQFEVKTEVQKLLQEIEDLSNDDLVSRGVDCSTPPSQNRTWSFPPSGSQCVSFSVEFISKAYV